MFRVIHTFSFDTGLLLRGDKDVQLVVLCAEKPTTTLLRRVAQELPIQLKTITEEFKYTVTLAVTESAVNVTDGIVTVKVSLTSPLLRERGKQTFSQAFAGHDSGTVSNNQFHTTFFMITFRCFYIE